MMPLFTLSEFDALLRKFIMEYNHSKHSQTGYSPKRRWEHNGFLPQLPENLEKLDLLLLTIRKPRKVMRDGIHFQGLRYIDPVLADYVGENIIIRYDTADLTSIRVFYKENFLCQPVCGELSHQSVSLKEIQAARLARKRALRKEIKHRLSLVDAILNQNFPRKNLMLSNLSHVKNKKLTKLKLYESDV